VLIAFNKQANRIEGMTMSVDYYDFNARLVQEYKYSNFKKFSKASTGSHKKRYDNVVNLLDNDKTLQKGVDLYERMPGVSDVNILITNFDTGEFSSFI
jgi:hypothetical protein